MPIGVNGEEVAEGDHLGARYDDYDRGSLRIDIEKFNSEEDVLAASFIHVIRLNAKPIVNIPDSKKSLQ